MERKDFLVGATAGLLSIAQVSNADNHNSDRSNRRREREGRGRRGGGNRMSGIANMITGTVGASGSVLALLLMLMIKP